MQMPVRQWSTESVDERQRLAYWMDSICASFLEMEARPADYAGFYGSIRQNTLGDIVLNEVHGTAQQVRRDHRAIANRGDNFYYLITQLGSPWSICHAGQDVVIKPGQRLGGFTPGL